MPALIHGNTVLSKSHSQDVKDTLMHAVGFGGEGEVTSIDVQHRTHDRTCLRIVSKQRSQLKMNARRAEWRHQSAEQLLSNCTLSGRTPSFISDPVEAVAHAHVEFSRPRDLQ